MGSRSTPSRRATNAIGLVGWLVVRFHPSLTVLLNTRVAGLGLDFGSVLVLHWFRLRRAERRSIRGLGVAVRGERGCGTKPDWTGPFKTSGKTRQLEESGSLESLESLELGACNCGE